MMKSVLISIHPEWCGKIVSGEKTIEIRKTRPKIKTPFKCYIYCTQGKSGLFYSPNVDLSSKEYTGTGIILNGKVIGEFICDKVTKAEKGTYYILPASETQMDVIDYVNYADEKPVYGWHISDLVIYDNPKELDEFHFTTETINKRIRGKLWINRDDLSDKITRPPQSWCYAESETENE